MFSWTLHLNGGPIKGTQAAVTVGDKVYSFGVDDRDDQIHVCVFNTLSLSWRKLTPVTPGGENCLLEVPSVCKGHRAVLIEYVVYIWGGYPYCSMLYAFDVDTNRWFKPRVSGTAPVQPLSLCLGEGHVYSWRVQPRLPDWIH